LRVCGAVGDGGEIEDRILRLCRRRGRSLGPTAAPNDLLQKALCRQKGSWFQNSLGEENKKGTYTGGVKVPNEWEMRSQSGERKLLLAHSESNY
jgi:hypothetical protein